MAIGRVAIVGRPNVGKSTIFNRVIKERLSIVEDVKGVTRDRIYAKAEWLTVPFSVIDTGGIEISDASFIEEIKAQAQIAIEEADVIIMVVSGRDGITNDDEYIAKLLYQAKKPVIVAVNKVDDHSLVDTMFEFYQFGFEVIAVSGLHGIGMGDLLDMVIEHLPKREDKIIDNQICFALIGRPNVGKSSITNALLGEQRVIVSDISGTTRDAIDTPFTRDNRKYVIIDTAGMKKKGKIYESVDKYASLRAMSAIERSQVVLVVIDGEQGIIDQDKHIAGYAHEAGKAVMIVVNKWDLVKKDHQTMVEFEAEIREQFKYLDYAPIAFVSALENKRMHTLFPLIEKVYENSRKRVQTSVLNDIIVDAQLINPTTTFNGGRAKIYYANQVAVEPPTFVLFVNNDKFLHFSYMRYLENRLRASFDFAGTPIKIIARIRE